MKSMRGWVLFAAATTAGCKSTSVPASDVGSLSGGDTTVYLRDETVYTMKQTRAQEHVVCGRAIACRGPSCLDVPGYICVPQEQIARVDGTTVDGAAVAIGVGATAAFIAGLAIAINASSHSSSSPPPPPPSSSSRYSGGGSLGSCPRAYSWDGKSWRLDSGTYGLSHFEAAPRTDFDRLDFLAPASGSYRLRLANEEDETEHTDRLRLLVVDHPIGTRVVPENDGRLHTFRHEQPALVAQDFRGKDARDLVATKDDREWSSDDEGRSALRPEDARDGLRLVFAKPRDAARAKLRIAAHNTEWAGQMLAYLFARVAPDFEAWLAGVNADPSARAALVGFLEREGMLHVRVKTDRGWADRGLFWPAGREIVKEEAFAIPVDDVAGERLEVELESALGFWGVDAVSVDYGRDEPVTVRALAPASARTADGRDVAAELAALDRRRLDTKTGDVTELSFAAPPAPAGPALTRSFVLETTGHYVPTVKPAAGADPAAMQEVMVSPFAASRLALAFRLARPR